MKVICAGAPKTGTKSLAKALRILGYDPVYDHEEAVEYAFKEWEDVFEKRQPDLNHLMDTAYSNVEAVVDAPHSYFFDHFLERWPDAKVILMTRDEDEWFISFEKTLDRAKKNHGSAVWLQYLSPALHRFIRWQGRIFSMTVGTATPHPFFWKTWYRRHNAYVRAIVPKSQLLEYNVTEGWKPLCEFLDNPEPKEDFPFENKAYDVRHITDIVMEETWLAKKAAKEVKVAFTFISCMFIAVSAGYFYLYQKS